MTAVNLQHICEAGDGLSIRELLGFDLLPGEGDEPNAVRFCLAVGFARRRVTYTATEDLKDGYRSCCGEITAEDGNHTQNRFCCKVRLELLKYCRSGECDLLRALDAKTGLLVFEVGTENIDDYYPAFVSHFAPDNMAINQERRPNMTEIKGDYELFYDDVLLRPERVAEASSSLLVTPDAAKDSTRWRVVAVGPEVQHVAPGDLVLASGRVTKVIAKDMLAEYVTPLLIRDQAHVIVPEDEIKALVS